VGVDTVEVLLVCVLFDFVRGLPCLCAAYGGFLEVRDWLWPPEWHESGNRSRVMHDLTLGLVVDEDLAVLCGGSLVLFTDHIAGNVVCDVGTAEHQRSRMKLSLPPAYSITMVQIA